MPGTRRKKSRSKKSVRGITLAIILCSGMSCLAPVLYASTDCSRWLAEYKQGMLQKRVQRHLRLARYRLDAMVHKPAPVHHYPVRHRMNPAESLHHFQIDCGDLAAQPDLPLSPAVIPPMPMAPLFAEVRFPDLPPELPPPGSPLVTADEPTVPTLVDVPVTPIENLPSPSPVPEPGSFVLVVSGALVGLEALRRKKKMMPSGQTA